MSHRETAVRVDSPTEQRDPRTLQIDTLPSLRVLELLDDDDARVPPAERAALPRSSCATASRPRS